MVHCGQQDTKVLVSLEISITMLIVFRVVEPVVRVLIFSLITDQRDGNAVVKHLATSLLDSGIRHVIFTTYKRDHESESRTGM